MKETSTNQRIQAVCRYIEDHSDEALRLDDLAGRAAMSRFHFARSFKSVVGVTPQQYVAEARMRNFKAALREAKPIDAALYDAGYGSPSRVYEQAGTRLGMTPAQYRRAGEGVAISYAPIDTPVGRMLVGATDRGICFIRFGEDTEELTAQLRVEYANAAIAPMPQPHHPDFVRWVDALSRHLEGVQPQIDLPLDIRATAFQMRVWRYLQSIPYGSVESYAEVAAGIGQPTAARAVARACAANPVAIAIPCHRVIRGTGELGGYRWGIDRKRALIDRERETRRAADAR
jgi:AraC family transcriptional regulator, regulatory protein of adaptative response / methylated-DNA-[protein]-cysteine methyltransferase